MTRSMVYTWFLVISIINLCKNTPNLTSSQISEILVHKWLRYLSLGTAVMTAGDFHSYLPIQKILIPPIQNSAPPRKIGKLLGQELSDKLINLIAFGTISFFLIQLITYRKYKEKFNYIKFLASTPIDLNSIQTISWQQLFSSS